MQRVRGRMWGWVVLTLGASLLVGLPAAPAVAVDPTSCPFVPGPGVNVVTWTGNGFTDRWGDPNNWSPMGVPNDSTDGNGDPETHDTYVCISPASRNTVVVSGDEGNFDDHNIVQAFYIGAGAAIDIRRGASLTVENTAGDPNPSYAAPGSAISVTSGTLGGPGTIRSRGVVSVAATPLGGASLSSRFPNGSVPLTDGSLVIDSDGELRFPNLGVNVQQRYRIELRGTGRSVVSGTGAIAANYGTRFEIGPSAMLNLAGPGGYYQGNTDGLTTLSQLVNAGRLVKTGGGTSVIDADYTEVGDGEMIVEEGTVAFPDGTTFPARVRPGQRMSTERCAPTQGFQACAVETNPVADPQSISLRVPSGDPGGAIVEVREHPVVDARAARKPAPTIFDGLAHAGDLRVDPLQPAVIEMRFDERRASGRELDNLSVYQDDKEIQTCLGTTGAPSLGQVACVDRRGRSDSTRKLGGNVYVVVRATETSRWRVRREAVDVAAPTLYTPTRQRRGNLGSVVRVVTKCDEKCTLTATGSVKVRGLGKLKLRKTTKDARANRRAVLKLRLTPAAARQLAASNARRGKAIVILKARDDAGNFVRQKVTVKLR